MSRDKYPLVPISIKYKEAPIYAQLEDDIRIIKQYDIDSFNKLCKDSKNHIPNVMEIKRLAWKLAAQNNIEIIDHYEVNKRVNEKAKVELYKKTVPWY